MSKVKHLFYWIVFMAGIAGPLFGLLGARHWFFDLFNHFRVHFTCLVIIAILILLAGSKFKRAALAGIVFIACMVSLFPYLINFKNEQGSTRNQIKIFYANVYTPNQKYEKIADHIRRKDPDIVILVEINNSWLQYLEETLKDFKFREAVPREDNFGVMVFSKFPLTSETIYLGSARVPSLKCEFSFADRKIILWATHPPPPVNAQGWALRNEHLSELAKRIAEEKGETIVAGDLNTTPWTHSFKLMTEAGLKNSAEGKGIQASWPSMWPKFMRIPIDHILLSSQIKCLEREVLTDVGSDHFPVYARIAVADASSSGI